MKLVKLLPAVALLLGILPGPPAGALGAASPNVEYVTTVPLEAGTWTTGKLHDGYFYASGMKSFTIYDVSDPASPQLVSHTPTGVQFINEDIDTNGEILLVTDERLRGILQVWDVSDKAKPVKLAELEGMVDHTFACVLDCTWAYGGGGDIVDLRDPANPKPAGRWHGEMPPLWGFDTYEVSPGVVVTGSKVMYLLDGRKDPANPKVLAQGTTADQRTIHSLKWPRAGKDKFMLVQSETSPKPQCDDRSGKFMTWDMTQWRKTKTFTMIDEYLPPAGNWVDANPGASALGCSATWFHHHPSFRNGGLVAGAFFDHGTRFLWVDDAGQIEEVGHYMPYGGSTTSTYWVTDEIVYSVDITHGIDVLRFTGLDDLKEER
ncbi:MAG TPA: hypothetical protein VEV43_10660 [Actinomycetota bacterium]|nr:hypothetical protein [Actinomycetota bacterium]